MEFTDATEDNVSGIGFVSSNGTPASRKHECEFSPFPNTSPYHKHGNTDLGYMTIGCRCGAVKEVVVQDLRPVSNFTFPPGSVISFSPGKL
jgi:hypothetical protein